MLMSDHIYNSLIRAQMRAARVPERTYHGALRALVRGLSNKALLQLLETPVREDAYNRVVSGLGDALFWAGDDLPLMIEAEAKRRGLIE